MPALAIGRETCVEPIAVPADCQSQIGRLCDQQAGGYAINKIEKVAAIEVAGRKKKAAGRLNEFDHSLNQLNSRLIATIGVAARMAWIRRAEHEP